MKTGGIPLSFHRPHTSLCDTPIVGSLRSKLAVIPFQIRNLIAWKANHRRHKDLTTVLPCGLEFGAYKEARISTRSKRFHRLVKTEKQALKIAVNTLWGGVMNLSQRRTS